MRRFTPAERALLDEAVRRGDTLTTIARNLCASKTAVIYHVRKQRTAQHFPQPLITPDDSEREGEILGIFAGDGSFSYSPKRGYYGSISVGVVNEQYLHYIRERFEAFFRKPFKTTISSPNTFILKLSGKSLFTYFHTRLDFKHENKTFTVGLESLHHSDDFLIGFLRGLIDTDGTVYFEGRCPRVRFYTSSSKLRNQFIHICTHFGFAVHVRTIPPGVDKHRKEHYRLSIRTAEDCRNFLARIRPWKLSRKGMGLPGFEPGPHGPHP